MNISVSEVAYTLEDELTMLVITVIHITSVTTLST